MADETTADVLVVGAGVIGCSVALRLAQAGLDVLVLERAEPGAGASGAAAGMLAPVCESRPGSAALELGLQSLGLFDRLAGELLEETGIDIELVACGALRAAADQEDAAHLRARAATLSRYGCTWLGPEETRGLEPRLPEDCPGALWSPGECHVRPERLTRALWHAARRHGARFRLGVPAARLVRQGERVVGVDGPVEQFRAGWTVLCGGAWSSLIADAPRVLSVVRPIRGQILALDAPDPPPRCMVWGEDVYLVPRRDGELVVGATMEEAEFDDRTTAEGVRCLLERAVRLLPATAGCAFRRAWAGLRPGSPDGLPLVGPAPGCSGLLLAAGHHRNGVLLSPLTGQAVGAWVLGEQAEPSWSAMYPSRFAGTAGAAAGGQE